MNRLKKAALLQIRTVSYRMRLLRLYYWAEKELYPLRAVNVMPRFYYRLLYRLCFWMVDFRNFRRLADLVIHTIPYHIRFDIAD
jgi:hypothetical protein